MRDPIGARVLQAHGGDTLRALRARTASPLNALASPGAATLAVLREIGIERVSFGPFVFRSCLAKLVDIAVDLRDGKGYDCFADRMLTGA